jgi:RNA polymerase sigma factor (sigma-70 family)
MSSQLALDPTAPSDAELIAAVRGGDQRAYGELFERHRDSAVRLARQLVPAADADDLVSEAFIKVLAVLQAGGGPDVAFRPYVLTAVRRLHVDRIRATSKVTPTDELERFDPGVPFADPAIADFENSAAAKAFASLPERWQMVLWHLEVEGQKPADIAPMLGMTANSVSALGYRAREGLRQAYLQMHLADTGQEECRWVTERLGSYVRGGLAKREETRSVSTSTSVPAARLSTSSSPRSTRTSRRSSRHCCSVPPRPVISRPVVALPAVVSSSHSSAAARTSSRRTAWPPGALRLLSWPSPWRRSLS